MSALPMIVCCACHRPAEGDTYVREGWLCKKCRLSASAVVTVYVIGDLPFTADLKKPVVIEARAS